MKTRTGSAKSRLGTILAWIGSSLPEIAIRELLMINSDLSYEAIEGASLQLILGQFEYR